MKRKEQPIDRCINCWQLKSEHKDNILRTNPEATFCPMPGMFSYQQMTPMELSIFIEEQREADRPKAQ